LFAHGLVSCSATGLGAFLPVPVGVSVALFVRILDDYLYFDLIRKQGMSRIDIQNLLPRLVAPYPISPHHLP